ncbi:MAG: hypothetical protein AAB573_02375 [Patescibacteria group bacterium]|mgnify:CR=1 FL=1
MNQGAPKTPDQEQPYGLYLSEFKDIDIKDYERIGREHFSFAEPLNKAMNDLFVDFNRTKRRTARRIARDDFDLAFRRLSNLYWRVDAFVKAAAKATPPRYDIAAALQPLVDKMKVIYETQQAVLTNKMPID